MFKKHPQFSFAFAIIFFAELFALTNNFTELRFVTKPLITISLMIFVYVNIKRKSKFSNRIILGLFFSLIGDVSLMFVSANTTFFMAGLGAFLVAHLFYLSAFYLDATNKIEVQRRYISSIFMVFGFSSFCFYFAIRPYLGDMSIPVLIYSLVITLMAIMAALRFGKINIKSFTMVLVGAILFMLSDSLLAYNKFVERIQIIDLFVMVTYMLAQFLICMGTVERKYIRIN